MKYHRLEPRVLVSGTRTRRARGVFDFVTPLFGTVVLLDQQHNRLAVLRGVVEPSRSVLVLGDFLKENLVQRVIDENTSVLVDLAFATQEYDVTQVGAWSWEKRVEVFSCELEPTMFHLRLVGILLGAYSVEVVGKGPYLKTASKFKLRDPCCSDKDW
jgi:hypothetical protein